MKTWNYRIVVDKDGTYSFREVFYGENKNIEGWTDECYAVGEDLADLRKDMEYMMQAFDREVLIEDDIMVDILEGFKNDIDMQDGDNTPEEDISEKGES